MKIEKLLLKNFGPHKATEIDFRNHPFFAICAENGTGKSLLISALPAILWGRIPGKANGSNLHDFITWDGSKEAELTAYFCYGNKRYKAQRILEIGGKQKVTKKTKALLWELPDEDNPIAGPKVGTFSEVVNELFGDLDSFLAGCMAAQGGEGDLIQIDEQGKRYEVLCQMIRAKRLLEIGEKAREAARILRKKFEDQDRDIENRIVPILNSRTELQKSRQELRELLSTKLPTRRNLTNEVTRLESELRSIYQELQTIQDIELQTKHIVEDIESKSSRVEEIRVEIRNLDNKLSQRQDLETKVLQEKQVEKLLVEQDNLRQAEIQWSAQQEHRTVLINHRDRLLTQLIQIGDIAQLSTEIQTLESRKIQLEEIYKQVENQKQIAASWETRNTLLESEIEHLSKQQEQLQKRLVEAVVPAPEGFCATCSLAKHIFEDEERIHVVQEKLLQMQEQKLKLGPRPSIESVDLEELNSVRVRIAQIGSVNDRQQQLHDLQNQLENIEVSLSGLQVERPDYDKQRHDDLLTQWKQILEAKAALNGMDMMSNERQRLTDEGNQLGVYVDRLRQQYEDQKAKIGRKEELHLHQKRISKEVDSLRFLLNGLETELAHLYQGRGVLIERYRQLRHACLERRRIVGSTLKERENAETFEELSRIYSRWGIIPIIISQVVPEIEEIASSIMDRAGRSGERILLDVEPDQNGRERFEIMICNEFGSYKAEQFSPGMQKMFQAVMRIAIARWQTERLGRPYEMLAVDEAFDALSPKPSKQLKEILRGIQESISQIMIVSHTLEQIGDIPGRLALETDPIEGVVSRWI